MRNRYIAISLTAVLALLLAGCHRNPEAAKRKYLESGQSYMDKKQYAAASIQFKKALQIDPRFAEAHYKLATALLALQRFQDAFKELNTTVELDPNNLKARADMGNLYVLSRSPQYYAKAEEQARYIIEHDPNSPDGYRLLGTVLFAEGHSQEALDAYTKLISLSPNDTAAYLNRGVLYASLKKFPEAESDFHQAIALDPKNLQGYANLAGSYQLQQQPDKAEAVFRDAIKNNPDAPANYLRLAGLLLSQNRTADAEKVLQDLRNAQPNSIEVAGAIGDFYVASRNPQAAIKEYQRGLTLKGKTDELKARLVEVELDTGNVQEATKLNDQMLKDKPGDVTARILHARLLAGQGKRNDAITTMRAVIKDAPENPQARFVLGQIYRQTGDLAGAKSELQEAIKRQPDNPLYLQALAETYRDSRDYDTATEYANRLLKLNPNNLQAHFILATVDIDAKNYKEALGELDIVQKGAPNDPMVHLNRAFAYYGLKNISEAEQEFQTAIKLNPQYDGAVADYVTMLYDTNQAARALQVAEQYVAANPNRASAHFIYGSALANDKKFDQAKAEYQKAIQLDPKAIQPVVQLARVYEVTGNLDAALNTYQQALAIQPDMSQQLHVNLGNIYLQKNDLTNALKSYQDALKINPNDPVAANDVAWVYALQGRNLDEALSLATQAKQTAPNLPSINDTLAWIHYKKGNYQLSVSLLEDAVKKMPDRAEFRYHLGMALNGAGDKTRAKAELQRALALNLKGTDAQDAQQTLASLQH